MYPKLKEEDVMELRADINSLLGKGKAPTPNLTKQERIGLTQLKRTRIVILTADKGVELVVMDKEDYISKAQEFTLSNWAYKEIPKHPTNKIKTKLITKLRRFKKDRNLDEGTYKAMYLHVCTLP